MNVTAEPERTYALVVGIEVYVKAPDWTSLDGPASDARRFVDWLQSRKVPANNILFFLSPLEENVKLLAQLQPSWQPATRDLINQAITKTLREKAGDLLYIFWGGHGVITAKQEQRHRLFYADADQQNKLNLDINSLLASLRTDYFQSLPRQIVIVDACANYIEDSHLTISLPEEVFPQGQPVKGREQFVLLAAKAGEYAVNLQTQKTGLFSQAVLERLAKTPDISWPPNMTHLAEQLRKHFNKLRAAGAAAQTPTYFYYSDWDGDKVSLGQPISLENDPQQSAPRGSHQKLTFEEKAEIVNALLACPTIGNPGSRQTVVSQLRADISTNIRRKEVDRHDVMEIITTCANYPGGLQELLDILKFFEGNSIPWQNLVEVGKRIILRFQSR